MDIERVFLSCFKIKEKPHDIFSLIEAALQVGASKYPTIFEKRKNRIVKFIMDPTMSDNDWLNLGVDDEEEEEDTDEQVTDDKVTDLVQHDKQFVGEKQQSHNTIVGSRKRTPLINESTKRVQVSPPHEKQLVSDCSFKKGSKKQSHKGDIKKMETNPVRKREEGSQQTPTQHRSVDKESATKERTSDLTKNMPPPAPLMKKNMPPPAPLMKKNMPPPAPLMKENMPPPAPLMKENIPPPAPLMKKNMPPPAPLMKMNAATKRVQVAHQKQLLSGCSSQKQSNCSGITSGPIRKETERMSDMKKKFESSKRKFEEKVTDQREAKRRTVMVDFHDMPKPANDPPNRCWDRRRL